MSYIYGLVDPRNGLILYVGRCGNTEERYKQHMADTGNHTDKGQWLAELAEWGLRPTLKILEECPPDIASRMESLYIAAADSRCFYAGVPMVNMLAR